MNPVSIVGSLRGRGDAAYLKAAIDCLVSFDKPLGHHDIKKAIDHAEEKGDEPPVFSQPSEALPPTFVVTAVVAAARLPHLPESAVRRCFFEVLPKVTPVMQAKEWQVALTLGLTAPMASNRRLLRCGEELIKHGARDIFQLTSSDAGGIDALATLWQQLFVKWLRASAFMHSTNRKHPKKGATATQNAVFLFSVAARRVVRVLRRSPLALKLLQTTLSAQAAVGEPASGGSDGGASAAASASTVALWFLASAHGLLEEGRCVPTTLVADAIMRVPGLATATLQRVAAGTVALDAETLAPTLLALLSNATIANDSVTDVATVLAAVDAGALASAVSADPFLLKKYIDPFVGNPARFTLKASPAFAAQLGSAIGRAVATAETAAALCQHANDAVKMRCSSGSDTAAVLLAFTEAIRAAGLAAAAKGEPAPKPPAERVKNLVTESLTSGSVDVVRAAWGAVAATGVHDELRAVLTAILKKGFGDGEDQARAVILSLPREFPEAAPLARSYADNCDTIAADRYNALLALKFGFPISGEAMAALGTVEATLPLNGVDELQQVSETACTLVTAGAGASPAALFAAMLTHPSGYVRDILRAFLRARVTAGETAATASVWSAFVHGVFGIVLPTTSAAQATATAAPPASASSAKGTAKGGSKPAASVATGVSASPTASSTASVQMPPGRNFTTAVAVAAAAVLATLDSSSSSSGGNEDASAIVAEVLLCCAHDFTVGTDDTFFTPDCSVLGRYRTSSRTISVAAFHAAFRGRMHLLDTHCAAVITHLTAALLGPTRALSSAAARALALLVGATTQPALAAKVISAIIGVAQTSTNFFAGLSEADIAISTRSTAVLQAYITKALTERNLIKTYTAKPPKGMNEDDYEDQKRKDAVLLEKGRAALEQELAKRTEQLGGLLDVNLSAFAALRFIGTHGGRKAHVVDAASTALPFLFSLLCDAKTVPALLEASADAVVGILHFTPLRAVADQLARLSGRLLAHTATTAEDVREAAALALRLTTRGSSSSGSGGAGASTRPTAVSVMLAPALISALIPLTRGIFKTSTSKNSKTANPATQHQVINFFITNASQASIPQKREVVDLLLHILASNPAWYKTVGQALATVTSHSDSAAVRPLLHALLTGADITREVAAQAFNKYSHFSSDREALVWNAVARTDAVNNVVKFVKVTLIAQKFEMKPDTDWPIVIDLLAKYGEHAGAIQCGCNYIKDLAATFPASQTAWFPRLLAVGRWVAVTAVATTASTIDPEQQINSANALCTIAETPGHPEDLLHVALSSGSTLLQACTVDTLKKIATTMQPRLHKPPTGATAAHKEHHSAIAAVWLSVIAMRLNDEPFLMSVIDQEASMLNNVSSAMVHHCVCECMTDIAAHPLVRNSTKLDEFSRNCVKQILQSTSYAKKKGHAYGLAGVVAGLGLKSLRRYDIVETLGTATHDKQLHRTGAMILIEVLCDVLGASFEPYALELTAELLDGVAEKDAKVSDCADDAAKAMMRCLSDVGLRQLVPRLVEGLKAEQPKKRTPALNFIGYVAFCSPRQLAATLPSIMNHICQCVFDVNASVSNTAFGALKRVAGVVSNSEIQEHVETLLKAMRNPATETEAALDGLLYTRFTNVVDPASLALIVPVISRGLGERGQGTKGKAAQIVASMVLLVKDPMSLQPYAADLLEKLQVCCQDPMMDVRATSAKAMASLVRHIRGPLLDDCIAWCMSLLRRATTSAERAGASQALVELCAACGDSVLAHIQPDIEKGATDPVANVREGFMHIFVYAPSTLLPNTFQKVLPTFFPLVLRGLGDPAERVREVALAAGGNIIALYGSRNLDLVLPPLLEGVAAEVTSMRQSAMLLASKLLIHFAAQIRKKLRVANEENGGAAAAEDDGAGNDEFAGGEEEGAGGEAAGGAAVVTMASARQLEKSGFSMLANLEEQLGADSFYQLLAAMHIGRSEHSATVRTEVTTAWQVCVASPRTALGKLFSALMQLLLRFGSSRNMECKELAEKCIEYTASRLNEFVDKIVVACAASYQEKNIRHQVGALVCLAAVVPLGDSAKLTKLGASVASCVMPALQDANEDVRAGGGVVFERVSKIVGPRWIESVVETQMASSVVGVVELVRVRPTATLAIAFRLLSAKKLYSEDDMELIQCLTETEQAEADLPRYFDACCDILVKGEAQKLVNAGESMRVFASYLTPEYTATMLRDFTIGMKSPDTRAATLRAAINFGLGLNGECSDEIAAVLKLVLQSFGDTSEETRSIAVIGFISLADSLNTKAPGLDDGEAAADENEAKRLAGRFAIKFTETIQMTLLATARSTLNDGENMVALSYPKAFATVLSFYTRTLDYGSTMDKMVAIDGMKELLEISAQNTVVPNVVAIIGKCVKTLFARNDGGVVANLLQLCQQVLKCSGSAQAMVEQSLATALFGGCLSDSTEARVLTHKLAVVFLRRNTRYAETVVTGVVSKRALAESFVQKAAMARYISVAMRHGKVERKIVHATTLLDTVMPLWLGAENTDMCGAAGSAVGSLCISIALADDQVASVTAKALAQSKTKGTAAIGAFACLYSLAVAAKARLDDDFYVSLADSVRNALGYCAGDRHSAAWVLRCCGALAAHPTARNLLRVESIITVLKRVEKTDETLMSTAAFVVEAISAALPKYAAQLAECHHERSRMWLELEQFDADIDDELGSQTAYVS